MKAIILSAGRGSRMRDLTENKPKSLIKLFDRALLEYQIYALKSAGISKIGIVTGYKSDVLAPFIKSQNLVEFHNANWGHSNMVYSLLCAKDWLKNSDFIISYSDIFYATSGVLSLINLPCDAGILYAKNWLKIWKARFGENVLCDAESFKLDSANNLLEIGNKAGHINEIQGQFMGLLKFSVRGFEALNQVLEKLDIAKIDCTYMLQKFLQAGNSVKCAGFNGIWGECDNQNDIKIYEQMYNKQMLENAIFAESASDSANISQIPPPSKKIAK